MGKSLQQKIYLVKNDLTWCLQLDSSHSKCISREVLPPAYAITVLHPNTYGNKALLTDRKTMVRINLKTSLFSFCE